MANLIAALIYVYMQFFATPKWLILIGHMSWQAGHGTTFLIRIKHQNVTGIPAFVYLLMNKTIQYELRRFFFKNASHSGSNKIGDTSTGRSAAPTPIF